MHPAKAGRKSRYGTENQGEALMPEENRSCDLWVGMGLAMVHPIRLLRDRRRAEIIGVKYMNWIFHIAG